MQNMLANQMSVLYTSKSCPIVGELASSPMEDTDKLLRQVFVELKFWKQSDQK